MTAIRIQSMDWTTTENLTADLTGGRSRRTAIIRSIGAAVVSQWLRDYAAGGGGAMFGEPERDRIERTVNRLGADDGLPEAGRSRLVGAWRELSGRMGEMTPEPTVHVDDDGAHLTWRSPRYLATLDAWDDGSWEWYFSENRPMARGEGSNGVVRELPNRFLELLARLSADRG